MTKKEWNKKMKEEKEKFLKKFGKYIKGTDKQKCSFMGLTPDDFKEELVEFTKDKDKKVPFNLEY